jgi:hypothetical protein
MPKRPLRFDVALTADPAPRSGEAGRRRLAWRRRIQTAILEKANRKGIEHLAGDELKGAE